MALYAIFEDNTSVTYGATGDRPVRRIMQAASTTEVDDNIDIDEDYIEVTDFVDIGFYKISWVSSAWTLATRALLSSVATWDATTLTADGVDSVTLGSGLPNPTLVYVETPPGSGTAAGTTSITTTDGSVTITTNDPGQYIVHIFDLFPYAPYAQIITAT